MTDKLLKIVDDDEIRHAADGRAEAADARTPDDGEENGNSQLAFPYVLVTDEGQHGNSDRGENTGDDDIWEKNRQERGGGEPHAYLLSQRVAHEGESLQSQPLVETG